VVLTKNQRQLYLYLISLDDNLDAITITDKVFVI